MGILDLFKKQKQETALNPVCEYSASPDPLSALTNEVMKQLFGKNTLSLMSLMPAMAKVRKPETLKKPVYY